MESPDPRSPVSVDGGDDESVHSAMSEFIGDPTEMKWDDLVAKMKKAPVASTSSVASSSSSRKRGKRTSKKRSGGLSDGARTPSMESFRSHRQEEEEEEGDGPIDVDELVASALSAIPVPAPGAYGGDDYPPAMSADGGGGWNDGAAPALDARNGGAGGGSGSDVENNGTTLPSENNNNNENAGDYSSGRRGEEWDHGTTSYDVGCGVPTDPNDDFFPDDPNDSIPSRMWGDKARSAYEAQERIEKGLAVSARSTDDDGAYGDSDARWGKCAFWCAWTLFAAMLVVLTGVLAGALTIEEVRSVNRPGDSGAAEVGEGEGGGNDPPFPGKGEGGYDDPDGDNEEGSADLSRYGYPYTLATGSYSTGWISWPRNLTDDNFATFDEDDGVVSVRDCAARCSEIGSDTGAWDVRYNACWCTFSYATALCREPCVEESYIQFSWWDIGHAHTPYCEASVCDEGWHHSASYCEVRVEFDKDACDAQIKIAQSAAPEESESTLPELTLPPPTSAKDLLLREANLHLYGYPYARHSDGAGWLALSDSDPHKVRSDADGGSGVSSAGTCASNCSKMDAVAGSWDASTEECWCATRLDPEDDGGTSAICREPCAEAERFDFSMAPFEYCGASTCAGDGTQGGGGCFVRDEDECAAAIEAHSSSSSVEIPLAMTGGPSSENAVDIDEIDLSAYGYSFVRHTTSSGWVSWAMDRNDEHLASFSGKNGIRSVEECAAKCTDTEASGLVPVGAWEVKYGACFCSSLDAAHLCREPCMEEEYVEFATIAFTEFDYCEESMCGRNSSYHDDPFCADGARFDEGACDAKVEALAHGGTWGMDVRPGATATTKVNSPDAKNEGLVNFSVENGEERVSFVRFDLSSVPEGSVLDEAILNLYLVRSIADSTEASAYPVAVHALPRSSKDWTTGSVSYNEPLDSEDEYLVASFDMSIEEKEQVFVDVTSAFDEQKIVTFKLSTDSDCIRVDFAGEKWDDGESLPILRLTLSEPTKEPSGSPTKEPTNDPSSSPTREPTNDPSSSPMEKPSTELITSSTPAPPHNSTESFEDLDLSMYGFPYVQHITSVGWVSWPQRFQDNEFASFDAADNVTSVAECASKCKESNADTGAWEVEDRACWCTSRDVTGLCKEPCVELEFVDFSTLPFAEFDYCTESFCDADWHHSKEYCENIAMFDVDACDAKIVALAARPVDVVSVSPSASTTTPKHTGSTKSEIDVDPAAMATAKYSSPDAKNEGLINFSVENGNERVSFVRFNLPLMTQTSVIESATLHLYLVRSILDSDSTKDIKVLVHVLPLSDEDWSSGSVSYDEPLEQSGEVFVKSLEVIPLDGGTGKKMYSVDVTSAIDRTRAAVTFKLSTGADARLDFAGENWNQGEGSPWMRFVLLKN